MFINKQVLTFAVYLLETVTFIPLFCVYLILKFVGKYMVNLLDGTVLCTSALFAIPVLLIIVEEISLVDFIFKVGIYHD